ncbi:SIR2 family NAD-dependent protein deacylase [Fimbriiglobus ruber]|uniref:NAD-dependent protein deacylase n=1 Tax=Fimbriiglobus ruber TaxID=1908690 RepID=A0A225E762_9BACT|nr:NAD-dependent deacylase [Fimbriiglobus ruber]OWK44505.1 NAD-dependent protein deacetylase of SIR2 family [Fimbriiglobus ruber]
MSDTADRVLNEALDRAAGALKAAKSVAVLTGAGVSAESGVPTFRASDGLWEGHRIEDVATPTGFRKDPGLVWKFYNARRANVRTVRPNPGHLALVKLEQRWGDKFTLVTQNVDGLHRFAGSKKVLEIHGSLYRTRCTGCKKIEDRGLLDLGDLPACPTCTAMLRPDIVWFHEALPEGVWEAAMFAAHEADVLLVAGTSAVVYPAASLIPIAKGDRSLKPVPGTVIEFNLTQTEASSQADICVFGPSGQTLPRLCERLGL